MKKCHWLLLAVIIAAPSCAHFRKPVTIAHVVGEKARIDAAENPALKEVIRSDLGSHRIRLDGLTVKDVTVSNNIDYDFCVVVDVSTDKGMVECHIYSKNVKTVAQLVKGESKIDVTGMFGRFFSLLDDYYTRLEIVNASIRVVN